MLSHISIIHKNKDISSMSQLRSFFHFVGVPCVIYNLDSTWDIDHLKISSNDVVLISDDIDIPDISGLSISDFSDIREILGELFTNEFIDEPTYYDLYKCCKVWNVVDYDLLYHLGYYCQPHIDESINIDLHDKYLVTIENTGGAEYNTPDKTHYKYITLNVIYEINLFCKKHGMDYVVNNDSLIKACREDGFLKLAGDAYLNIYGDINSAFYMYPRYDDAMHGDIYRSLGNIFIKKIEFHNAISYFKKSVDSNPNDYRSYWQLAMCSKGDNDQQKQYFSNVIDILKASLLHNGLNAIESEYFIKSCLSLIELSIDNNPIHAFDYCLMAIYALNDIKSLRFFNRFGDKYQSDVYQGLVSTIDLKLLKKRGLELSARLSNFEHIDEFKSL